MVWNYWLKSAGMVQCAVLRLVCNTCVSDMGKYLWSVIRTVFLLGRGMDAVSGSGVYVCESCDVYTGVDIAKAGRRKKNVSFPFCRAVVCDTGLCGHDIELYDSLSLYADGGAVDTNGGRTGEW